MNHSVALKVSGLSKSYRLGQPLRYRTLRDFLSEKLTAPWKAISNRPGTGRGAELFWALRDVSFSVSEGEVIGVIGKNGAGKSTLLKILARITEPTTGEAEIRGRVASLLEVGVGFHPELSGRENIFLNGAILGMRKAEISRKFDEIVAFAEVDRFIDTPVKHYSSGMYMRLAFAVAAHLQPEILLIDEVLAVGDAAFQKKCLGKMGNVAREGRTVLFVSHNMLAVESLCHRVLWLEDGRIKAEGRTGPIISRYLEAAFVSATDRRWASPDQAPGGEAFRMARARVQPQTGNPSDPIGTHSPIAVEIEYWNLEPGASFNINLQVYNQQEILIFEAGPSEEPIWRPLEAGLHRDVCYIPGNLLNSGMHRVAVYVVAQNGRRIHHDNELLVFDVRDSLDMRAGWYGEWAGAVRPNLRWTRHCLSALSPEEPVTAMRS